MIFRQKPTQTPKTIGNAPKDAPPPAKQSAPALTKNKNAKPKPSDFDEAVRRRFIPKSSKVSQEETESTGWWIGTSTMERREEITDVTVEQVDIDDKARERVRQILESEYVDETMARVEKRLKKNPNFLKDRPDYDFAAEAARERGNRYETEVRSVIDAGFLKHPLLERERGLERATIPKGRTG